jgi:hypothetical protein
LHRHILAATDRRRQVARSDFSLRDAVTNVLLIPRENGTVSWNATSRTTTWTHNLSGGVLLDGNSRVYFSGDGITDVNGVRLDGDNDGVPGGDFTFHFHVLASDANRDPARRLQRFGDTRPELQHDRQVLRAGELRLRPGGDVDFNDLALLAQRYNMSMPPAPAPSAAVAVADALLPESSTTKRRQPAHRVFNATLPMHRKKPSKPLTGLAHL